MSRPHLSNRQTRRTGDGRLNFAEALRYLAHGWTCARSQPPDLATTPPPSPPALRVRERDTTSSPHERLAHDAWHDRARTLTMIDPPLLRSARTHRTELPQSCTPGRRFFIDMRWTRNVELPMMVLTPLLSRGTWTEHDGFHTIVESNTMDAIARHGGTGPVRGTGDKSSVMGLSVPLPVCRLGRHADGHAIAWRTVLGHVGPTSS